MQEAYTTTARRIAHVAGSCARPEVRRGLFHDRVCEGAVL